MTPLMEFSWTEKVGELLSPGEWESVACTGKLTSREASVCQLLFEGLTRPEIASHLGIKPRTVRQHLETIHQKLHVKNRVGVVLRIVQIRDWLRQGNAPE